MNEVENKDCDGWIEGGDDHIEDRGCGGEVRAFIMHEADFFKPGLFVLF